MPHKLKIHQPILASVVGGKSAIDMPRLAISSAEEASQFLLGYGFNIENKQDLERLWYFHRRALVFLEEKLGFSLKEIPDLVRDAKQLGDIRQLLLLASSTKSSESQLRRWACALLRVMHVFVHSENDLFSTFSEEIQNQILTSFQENIYTDGSTGKTFLKSLDKKNLSEAIALVKFEVKPFKTSTSTVIKLLAKHDALAMSVLDKLGVRFVTENMVDAYRVISYLIAENLVSFPHIIPDQSSNNIYPVDLFLQVMEELQAGHEKLSHAQIDELLRERLAENKHQIEFLRKENNFSGNEYKFIKFISRKMIRLKQPNDKGEFSFFFPYEVQIMDQESYQKILSGPAEHQAYKERQKQAARKRVFPEETL